MMEKKPNKIALALWAIAILLAILNSAEIWNACQHMRPLRQHAGEGHLAWAAMVHSVSNAVVQFAFLAALATLIEIADRILWQTRKAN